ncbi:hypothetical protein vseg_005651 [Gypsophila vaccaria]
MAAMFKFHLLHVLVLLLLISQGLAECNISNVHYGDASSGKIVGGKKEWNVVMFHTCKNCSMGNIIFKNCENWHTVEPVDPDIILKHDRFCMLKKGQFLKPREAVTFSYAWDLPVVWVPLYAEVRC